MEGTGPDDANDRPTPSPGPAGWDKTVYRVMDANLNRAREGLRVVEEMVRLGLGDRALTAQCRRMRHALARYPEKLPGGARNLMAGRDAWGDVGAPLWPEEAGREGLRELVAANLKRTQEALRVLEEYAKVLGAPVAELKALRFDAYSLERNIVLSSGPEPVSAGRRRIRRPVGAPARRVGRARWAKKERCRK